MFGYNCKHLISQESYEYRTENTGHLICHTRYLRGKKDGPETIYGELDEYKYIFFRLNYRNGKRHGMEFGYNVYNGTMIYKRKWYDGKLYGMEICSSSDGKITGKYFFVNNMGYYLTEDGKVDYSREYHSGRICDMYYGLNLPS